MVSNIGKITNLAATPSTGLVDGSDKLHSGILKVLESFSQGDMCISHAGFTITDGGTYTQYNLAQPIKFLKKGEFVNHTVTLTEAYTSSPVQNASHTRYDWVLINPATPELVIVQGTAASTPTVADITAGYIPIALVQVTAGTDDDKFDYSFQTYTMNVAKNSVSIGYDSSGYTEAGKLTGDANGITMTGLYKLDTLPTATVAGADKIIIQDSDDSDKIKTVTATAIAGLAGLDIDGYSALGGTGLHQTEDHFVFSDNGTEKKITFSNLQDAIFADVSGDATIAAGGALTIGANAVEGSMLNSNTACSGLDYGSNQLSVDVSDFMTNGLNNRIVTATGTDGMNGEENLTFDGTDLKLLKDANNADVSLTLGTSDSESLKIQVLNGSSNRTAEKIQFTTATASSSTDAGQMVFNIDGTDRFIIDDGGIDITGAVTATTSITGAEVTGTVFVKTGGLEFIGSEVLQDGVLPVPSYAKSIIFINDISAGPSGGGAPVANQIVLPDASTVSTVRLTFRNINAGTAGSQNSVTIIPDSTTPDVIDFGQTDHAYVTSANVITLAVGQSITLHAITDAGGAPIQTGWYVIGI